MAKRKKSPFSVPMRPSRSALPKQVRRRLAYALAGLIGAVVVAAVAAVVFHQREKTLSVGATAPGFTLSSVSGATISLATLRGKPTLLAFCATWSSKCAVESGELNAVFAARPGSVVAIDADSETRASVRSFVDFNHVRYPILLDQGPKTVSFPKHGPRGPVSARYHVTELPTYYVLDPAGRVAWVGTGRKPAALLARELRRAARPLP